MTLLMRFLVSVKFSYLYLKKTIYYVSTTFACNSFMQLEKTTMNTLENVKCLIVIKRQ